MIIFKKTPQKTLVRGQVIYPTLKGFRGIIVFLSFTEESIPTACSTARESLFWWLYTHSAPGVCCVFISTCCCRALWPVTSSKLKTGKEPAR